MSFFGLPRGRNKALNTVRLVLAAAGTTNNATLYYDSGYGNGQTLGAGATVTFWNNNAPAPGTNWLPLYATGGSGTATSTGTAVNNIEIFDSFGFTARLGTGASPNQVDFLMDLPGGNGFIPVFIAAGTQLWIAPITNPTFDPTAASQPEFTVNFYD